MQRRVFLRGLGGAVVAAPFLGSIGGRGARAQSAVPGKRLIGMFTHYGCVTTRFFPANSHGPLSAADLQPTTLKHLAPFVDKLLIPRGIRGMNEWTAQLLRGQGNDSHTQVVKSYFTCQPVSPNSDDPFRFTDAKSAPDLPMGPSLDHVIAQSISPSGVPFLLQLGNLEGVNTSISWSAANMRFPTLNLKQAYSHLTGLFNDGAPVTPDTYQAAVRGKSIIDLVGNDLDTLERFDMSQADRRKLDAWKELLHQTGSTIAAASCGQDGATALNASQANVSSVSGLRNDALSTIVSGTLDGADIHSSVAVLAALCDETPVILLKYPAFYVFSGLGISHDSHNLSHRLDSAAMAGACLPGAIDMLLTIQDFYARKFAYLVGLLDSVSEGDGKMLDHTAAVWFQEMSDGAAHNLNNLPIIQAGSAGGYFKTGWAVNVADGSPNLSSGQSESVCTDTTSDMIVGTTQATGTDPTLANAPINKYFCNLMNALGVRAGADGFAAKDGTEEVTHFGRYDKTEDFIHGDVNPPKIWDPGEFTALKANA